MNNLKQLIDAVAVIVGNALRFNLMSWDEAKIEAARMRADHEQSKESYNPSMAELLDSNDEKIEVETVATPLRFLGEQLVQWMCALTVLYLGFNFIKLAMSVIIKFILFVFVLWAINATLDFFFGDRKLKDVPAPMEPSAS